MKYNIVHRHGRRCTSSIQKKVHPRFWCCTMPIWTLDNVIFLMGKLIYTELGLFLNVASYLIEFKARNSMKMIRLFLNIHVFIHLCTPSIPRPLIWKKVLEIFFLHFDALLLRCCKCDIFFSKLNWIKLGIDQKKGWISSSSTFWSHWSVSSALRKRCGA